MTNTKLTEPDAAQLCVKPACEEGCVLRISKKKKNCLKCECPTKANAPEENAPKTTPGATTPGDKACPDGFSFFEPGSGFKVTVLNLRLLDENLLNIDIAV